MTFPNSNTEAWLAVVGYEGRYEVSSVGRVRRINNLRRHKSTYLLKQGECKHYRIVALYKDGQKRMMRVHVLVAAAFLGVRPPAMEVNHINLLKNDNRASNLEYLTHAENMIHAHRNGRGGGIKGEGSPHTNFKPKDIRAIRKEVARGVPRRVVAQKYKVTKDCIHGIVSRRRWKHI